MNLDFLRRFGAAPAGSPVTADHGGKMMLHLSKTEPECNPRHTSGPFAKQLRWHINNPPRVAERWQITPIMAEEMLKWNDRNRPLSTSVAKNYADQMKAGRWVYTGEPIIFSTDRLIDGQHRLAACADAGVSIDALVVFGAPDDAFSHIDRGKTRSPGDIFAINGVPNANLMAAAVKYVVAYHAGTMRTRGASGNALTDGKTLEPDQLYEAYCKHPRLQESAWVGHAFAAARLASPSMMIGLHYLCAQKNRDAADTFFNVVAEGIGFKDKNDPAYKLHRRLIDNATKGEKLGRTTIAALTVKAWNATRLKRAVALRFGVDEAFPKVL